MNVLILCEGNTGIVPHEEERESTVGEESLAISKLYESCDRNEPKEDVELEGETGLIGERREGELVEGEAEIGRDGAEGERDRGRSGEAPWSVITRGRMGLSPVYCLG